MIVITAGQIKLSGQTAEVDRTRLKKETGLVLYLTLVIVFPGVPCPK